MIRTRMMIKYAVYRTVALTLLVTSLAANGAAAQTATFEPTPGQAGKDVVWVPTPQELVEKMLDMAKVTPQDIVIDLGSGDGRNVIAAAKRGARPYRFQVNPDVVARSRLPAQPAGTPCPANAQPTPPPGLATASGAPAAPAPSAGRLDGAPISFTVGDTPYHGKVSGDRLEGTATTKGQTQSFTATKSK